MDTAEWEGSDLPGIVAEIHKFVRGALQFARAMYCQGLRRRVT
jgi:hypothetical protein